MTFASTTVGPSSDGLSYAADKLLPAAEGSLFNLGNPFVDPVPVLYDQACFAVVKLTAQGAFLSGAAYVVMQTDLGDNVWIDLAWGSWAGVAGSYAFVLAAGMDGANAFAQSRVEGSAPATALGSNQCALGGRLRFVGKGTVVTAQGASSSSSQGQAPTPGYLARVKYKLLGLR